ncbi:hypothetical protein ABBQ32_010037 [Trebouxia sp. C0010 RCD-2024]
MRLSVLGKADEDETHQDSVWTCAWSPNSDLLVTGSVDESVNVYHELDGKVKRHHNYSGHTLGVISVDVDPSGEFAASSALDSFIRVWSLQDHITKDVIETPPSETWAICFNPASDTLQIAAAGGSSNGISLYNCDGSGTPVSTMSLPAGDEKFKKDRFVLSIAFSPDGQWLACGSQDGTVAVFDVSSGKFLHLLEGHFKPVRSLTFTPDSKMLLTACDDMHSHLYDVEHASLVEAFSGHESWVLSVACHPSGSCFATGSSDSKVKLWDMSSRSCAQTLTEHSDQVWDVAFNAAGNRFASVSDDKNVALYSFQQ